MKLIATKETVYVTYDGTAVKRMYANEFEETATLNDVWEWAEKNGNQGDTINITLCKAGE